MSSVLTTDRPSLQLSPWLLARLVAVLLFVKTFGAVLYEYRWYFPLDFRQSAFLVGREASFVGSYRIAFYVHLLAGPIALLAATFLMVSGLQKGSRLRRWHPIVGRLQLVAVVPLSISGMIMARNAFTGPIAGASFFVLAILALCTCIAAGVTAMRKNFIAHQVWATRCFVLLCSPLLLRIVGGIALVTGLDSENLYRWNAWCSWLVPLMTYELLRERWSDVDGFLSSLKNAELNRVATVEPIASADSRELLAPIEESNESVT